LTPKQNEASNTTHKELCDQALKHYQEISDKDCHFNSIVPKAIEFYKNMPQNLPQECLKSCCKLAYSAGWWAGIDKYKLTHHPQQLKEWRENESSIRKYRQNIIYRTK